MSIIPTVFCGETII